MSDLLNSTHTTPPARIPAAALFPGLLGLLPFWGLALSTELSSGLDPLLALMALIMYAAVILSFVGAVSWGIALADPSLAPGQRKRLLHYSVLPSLVAWLIWFFPEGAMRWVAFAALTFALYLVDLRNGQQLGWPKEWLTLRLHLSATVGFLLLLAAVGHVL
jgi:hypothetical protein